jgi:hypothetical protein
VAVLRRGVSSSPGLDLLRVVLRAEEPDLEAAEAFRPRDGEERLDLVAAMQLLLGRSDLQPVCPASPNRVERVQQPTP